jgi:hypothetical protein
MPVCKLRKNNVLGQSLDIFRSSIDNVLNNLTASICGSVQVWGVIKILLPCFRRGMTNRESSAPILSGPRAFSWVHYLPDEVCRREWCWLLDDCCYFFLTSFSKYTPPKLLWYEIWKLIIYSNDESSTCRWKKMFWVVTYSTIPVTV